MKTSELIGSALDWAVAKCEGVNPTFNMKSHGSTWHGWWVANPIYRRMPHYSTNWSQGGQIIEREGINTFKYNKLDASEHDKWGAHKVVPRKAMDGVEYSAALCLDGPTPLIAAMRCYVASKFGDEVDIPKELLGEQ